MYKNTAPKGFMKIEDAADYLGLSRQGFYARGAKLVTIYRAGSIISEEDVERLKRWLDVRRGLFALGVLPGNFPVVPDDQTIVLQAMDGQFDAACPNCGGLAVASDDTPDMIYCPNCGLVPRIPTLVKIMLQSPTQQWIYVGSVWDKVCKKTYYTGAEIADIINRSGLDSIVVPACADPPAFATTMLGDFAYMLSNRQVVYCSANHTEVVLETTTKED